VILERGDMKSTGYWKYWLTLVVGTVLLTASITWLVMNVGAQGMPSVIESGATVAEKPNLVWQPVKDVTMINNIIEAKPGQCHVGQASTVEIPFKNEGKGPLKIQLTETSCACVHDVSLNGEKMEIHRTWHEVPAGQPGTLRFSWTPKKEQLQARTLRLTAMFTLPNEPDLKYSNGLRLEIVTEVVE
jgi:hypothetical protein